MFISKKKIIVISFLLLFVFAPQVKASSLASNLSGRILIQVEKNGEAYYVNPLDLKGYFLGRPTDVFSVMRSFGLGISNNDLNYFLLHGSRANLSGRILLQVEDKGQAYYVNPVNLRLYYLGRPNDAFNIMRQLGLGISNANLSQISLQTLASNFSSGEAETSVVPGEKKVRFNFKYKNKNYYLDQTFSDSLYNSYKNSEKILHYPANNPPQNLRESYYNIFLTAKSDDPSINNLITGLKNISKNENFSDDEFLEFAMALVQYIPYDTSKTSASSQNFPYETLYKNSGVCSDKAFLALTVIRKLGYGGAIFDYPLDNHSAVAVACSGQSSYNSGYCFIETTNYFPVGVFPSNLSSGQAGTSSINWSQIFSGNVLSAVEIYQKTTAKSFSRMSIISNEVSAISKMENAIQNKKVELDSLLIQVNNLKSELDQILSKLNEYQRNNDISSYNAGVVEYNTKVETYNQVLSNYTIKASIYNNDIGLFNKTVKEFFQN